MFRWQVAPPSNRYNTTFFKAPQFVGTDKTYQGNAIQNRKNQERKLISERGKLQNWPIDNAESHLRILIQIQKIYNLIYSGGKRPPLQIDTIQHF